MTEAVVDNLVRVLAAWGAGSLIGLERTFRGRPAGFRTHALVSTASALLMLVTSEQWQWLGGAPLETIRTDPTRMAQGIMTGIGFLGGGVIFREGLTVRGLTTAASIWATAAVGILYGIGLYVPALVGTVIVLGTLGVFRWVEDWLPNQIYAHLTVTFPKTEAPPVETVRSLVREHGFKLANFSYATSDDGSRLIYRTVIHTTKRTALDRLAGRLRTEATVSGFSIVPTGD